MDNKRGLSPVIATVLLVLIVVILGSVIYLWARSFVTEKVEKFGEPIENSCTDISFKAEIYEGKIHIANEGSIPLFGVEVKKKGIGSSSALGSFEKTIKAGQSEAILIPNSVKLNVGDTAVITPVIVGESDKMKKTYPCSAKEISVKVEA